MKLDRFLAGRLDNATLELMARPRCGMKDVESSGVRRKRASCKCLHQSTGGFRGGGVVSPP